MKYVRNDIVKPFRVKILRYVERVREMHELAKYLPLPLMKEEITMTANWLFHNEEFNTGDIPLVIRDGLPKSMSDELEDHPEDYLSLTYEYWCDLLSSIEVKDERKRAAGHIKKISSARAASLSNSDKSLMVTKRKKYNTGVSNCHKSPRRAHDRHHGAKRYCVLCDKARMPECKSMSYSTKDCTDVSTKCSIKDGMGGPIGSRTHAMKHHKKS